jgi:hypothetical protein
MLNGRQVNYKSPPLAADCRGAVPQPANHPPDRQRLFHRGDYSGQHADTSHFMRLRYESPILCA